MGSRLEVTVLEDPSAFEALEEEWEELHRHSPRATPFQSWAWLYSWWESYGQGYEMRLVVVREEEGLLVGLAPLMVERWGGLGRLLFVGTHRVMTPYQDVLVREGWEDRVEEVLGDALRRLEGWQVADLQQLRPGALAWGLLERWEGPKACAWEQNYLLIEVKPWEELLMSLSRKLRGNARRAVRRAEADGIRPRVIGEDESEGAARRLVALHRELWQGRGIAPEHLSEKFENLIVAAAPRMTASGLGSIYEFVRDGEAIISGFLVFGDEFDGAYMVGAGNKALQLSQWGSLTYWYEICIAHGRNSAYLSLMDGDPPYKARWASERVPSYHMVLGRSLALWFPYAGYHVLRSKARRYRVESGITPQWARDARKRYRTLRSRAFWQTVGPGSVLQRVKNTKWSRRR